MSSNVDERVVEMVFDNKKFEKNAKQTLNTLDTLDKSLDLKGATKGFKDLEKAAKNCDLSSISDAVDAVNNKFSIMGTIGDQILRNLTNRAADFAVKWAKSMTIDQVTSGWSKYEAKTKAVQVMIHATGEDISTVNGVLADLNEYTDNTSYRFNEMVDSMSKFTASGIHMDNAEKMVEGIANWAASSGVEASRASMAFYNLSQAVGSGALKLQDWKSIENLNMNTKEFEETAIAVAQAMIDDGRASKEMAAAFKKANPKVEGFRDSLSSGWLDKDVMTELFKVYADRTQGVGKSAYAAAYEAKSLTDAIEAAKESVASGWANIFEQIFGNYEEARVFWTEVADAMIEVFSAPTNALSELLTEWHERGGYVAFIESIRNAWAAVKGIGEAVKEVFQDVFPEVGYKKLVGVTQDLRDLTQRWRLKTQKFDIESMLLSPKDIAKIEKAGGDLSEYYEQLRIAEEHNAKVDKNLEAFRDTLEGVFSILNFVRAATGALFKIVLPFTKLLVPITKIIGTITAALGRMATALVDRIMGSERFNAFIEKLTKFAEAAADKIAAFGDRIADFLDEFLRTEFMQTFVSTLVTLWETLKEIASPYVKKATAAIGQFADTVKAYVDAHASDAIKMVGDALLYLVNGAAKIAVSVGNKLVPMLKRLWANLKAVWTWLKNIGGNLKQIWNEQIVPSKAYQAIRGRLANLVDAIKNFAKKFIDILRNGGIQAAFDWLKDQFDALVSWVKKINIGKALEAGILLKIISAILTFRKITKTLKYLRSFLVGFPKALQGFSKGLLVKRVAASILLLAAALWVLSQIPSERLDKLLWSLLEMGVALVGLTLIMALVMKLLGKGEKFKESFAFTKAVSGIMALALSVLVLSAALKIISTISSEKLQKSILALVELLAAITIAAIIMSTGGKTMLSAGFGLLAFVSALLLLSFAFEKIKKTIGDLMNPQNQDAAIGLTILFGSIVAVMVGLSLILKGADKDAWKLSAVILSFGAALFLIALAVERIGTLKGNDFLKAMGVLGALFVMVLLLSAVSKGISGESGKKILAMAAAILAIGLAVNGIAAALIILSMIPQKVMYRGLLRLTLVAVLMSAMLKAAGKIKPKSAGGILMMAVLLGSVVAALWFLQGQDLGKILISAVILSSIMLALGVAMRVATKFANGTATAASLFAMAVLIAILSQSLISLSNLPDPGKLLAAAVSLGAILLVLATSIAISGKGANTARGWATMLGMMGLVLGVAGALYVMTNLPLLRMMLAAIILVAIVKALGRVAISIGRSFSGTTNFAGTIAAVATMFALLGFTVGALWALSSYGLKKLVVTGAVLAGLMMAMSLCISVISRMPHATLKGDLAIAAMFSAIIFPIVAALALAKRWIPDPSGLESISLSIAAVVLSMTAPVAACMSLGKALGGLHAIGAAAGGALGFGVALAILIAVVVAIGWLVEILGSEDVKANVERAADIMESVGRAIGGFIGALIAGIGDPVFNSIEQWGKNIRSFCEDVSIGINSFNGVTVNHEVITAIGDLADAILTITRAELVNGILDFISRIGGGEGANAMSEFAKDLLILAPAFTLFSALTKNADASHTTEVAQAIRGLAEAAQEVGWIEPEWLERLIGRPKTLGEFAEDLLEALPGITSFMVAAAALSGFVAVSSPVIDAIGDIVVIANNMPREDGLLQDLIGKAQDLGSFGGELGRSIPGISEFFTKAKDLEENASAAEAVAKAIGELAKVANSLHRTGGMWQKIAGEIKPFDEFAQELSGSTDGIMAFAEMSAKISNKTGNMSAVTSAIGDLVEVANALKPESSTTWEGWKYYKEEAQSLAEFMTAFGSTTSLSGNIGGMEFNVESGTSGVTEQISTFATKMTELKDSGALDGLDAGIVILDKLRAVGGAAVGVHETYSTIFGSGESTTITLLDVLTKDLEGLGSALNKFVTEAGSTDIQDFTAAEALHHIVQAMIDYRKLFNELTGGQDFASEDAWRIMEKELGDIANTFVYLIRAFNDADKQIKEEGLLTNLASFQNVISLFDRLGDGNVTAESIAAFHNAFLEASSLHDAVTAGLFVSGIADMLTAETNILKFSDAARQCVEGFKQGILDNIRLVEAAADSLSDRTISAMRRALRIQSPSRVMRQIGDYAGEGYYLGLQDWVGSSFRAGEDLSAGVTEAAIAALDYISALMNGDLAVDVTIRPVLDLSNMNSGMNELDAMFSRRQAVMANVDAGIIGRSDEVNELINVSWQILREIQNGRDIYLDGKVLAGSMNRRLGRAVDTMAVREGGL